MSKIMPYLSFVFAVAIVAFGLGVFITEYKIPPYLSIASGAKTLTYSIKALSAPPYVGQFLKPDPAVPAADAAAARFSATEQGAALDGNILITGGLNEYLDYCPDDGCVAIELDRQGKLVQAYPYRPDEIFAADITGGSYYREGMPSDPRLIIRPMGIQKYPGGDLLVSFQSTGTMFPFGGGVARLAPDGMPRWFRFDYGHHWVRLLDDGRIVIPDLVLGEGNWDVKLGTGGPDYSLFCDTGRPEIDGITFLDGDGQVTERIDVNEALRASPFAVLNVQTFNACDPLHINYVDVLDETAPGGDLAPGNLVVSVRNLSTVLIMDGKTHEVLRVVKGSFLQQHSVHQLEGSRAVLFDNWGGAGPNGGSRVIEIDLAGGPERLIFPQPGSPYDGLYSYRASNLDISADKRRALVSVTDEGRGFEIDLQTGKALLAYNSLHDLSGVSGASDGSKVSATRSKLFGMFYLDPQPGQQ